MSAWSWVGASRGWAGVHPDAMRTGPVGDRTLAAAVVWCWRLVARPLNRIPRPSTRGGTLDPGLLRSIGFAPAAPPRAPRCSSRRSMRPGHVQLLVRRWSANGLLRHPSKHSVSRYRLWFQVGNALYLSRQRRLAPREDREGSPMESRPVSPERPTAAPTQTGVVTEWPSWVIVTFDHAGVEG